ncbi:MAG: hypothetical protein ACREIP_21905 [Alphaproteobacteria bacterium]
MTDMHDIWHGHYAWLPVLPRDEAGPFWLETLWRRRSRTGRWEYRSFRSENEKNRELVIAQFWSFS